MAGQAAPLSTDGAARRRRIDPFAILARGATWMAGIGLLTLLIASGQATRFDRALYDLNMRYWSSPPRDDVVIVAIDPGSLAALGRWPWPRDVHARLIDRLTADGVRGIGMDVTISEPDALHPGNDRALAAAIARNGHVVMPMLAEAPDLGGTLQETLPIPAIARSAAGIGQVDVAVDSDSVVRGAYLKAGLGSPYWPSLALAMYRLGQSGHGPLPGQRHGDLGARSPYLWIRDDFVLLRYAGPAGSFDQVSYKDVLDGRVPRRLLQGRWVMVGATAMGLGDQVLTPVATMPGVEYQANVLESLRRGTTILPLNLGTQWLLGSLLLSLPLLLHGAPGLRRLWRTLVLCAGADLLLSLLLLRLAYVWWPPMASLLLLVAGTALAGLQASLGRRLRQRRRARHVDALPRPAAP
jgi:CHASE2 domain-containing sensor protein